MLEQELKNALHAGRPEPPQGFDARSDAQLARLTQKDQAPVKRFSRVTLAVALILALGMATALAAANGWDVLQFLFWQGNTYPSDMPITEINREMESKSASMKVSSAMYDGRALIFDWCVKNKQEVPLYAVVSRFTANGERIWTDGADSFDCTWIGYYDDSWQDGEIILLPDSVVGAETLRVDMEVTFYRPERPVYRMEEFDPDGAVQKAAEGYYVIPDAYGVTAYDEEESRWVVCMLSTPEENMGGLQTERIAFSFDLVLPTEGIRHLPTDTVYENAHCTALYTTADLTPMGLYLTLRLYPKEEDGVIQQLEFGELTDGEGRVLFGPDDHDQVVNFQGVGYGHFDENGDFCVVYECQWYGLKEAELPDVVSLSWVTEEGSAMVFPVKIR